MSGHTPGPWDWTGPHDTTINGHPHTIWDVNNGITGVAIVLLPEEDDEGDRPVEREATARLIAAAPDLLEALQEALDALVLADQDRFDGGRLTGKIRAAITKARPPASDGGGE